MTMTRRRSREKVETDLAFAQRVVAHRDYLACDRAQAELDLILADPPPASWRQIAPTDLAQVVLLQWADRLKKELYPNTGWRDYAGALRALARGGRITRKQRGLLQELEQRMIAARRCNRVAAIQHLSSTRTAAAVS